MYQYIQVRRENKTFFIECTAEQMVLEIKKELFQFVNQEPQDMRLYLGSTLLDDACSVYGQGIQNNSVLEIKLKNKSKVYKASVFNDSSM